MRILNDHRRFSPLFAAAVIFCVCIGVFVKQQPFPMIGWIGVVVIAVAWLAAVWRVRTTSQSRGQ